MLTSRLPRLFVLAALMSIGGEIAVARDGPASDFSALQEWKNQIAAELEHNKRYLPATRTRGKIGVVKFELNINRSGWVLPGTRIVTADPDLGRVALLLLQQSQPFPAPDNFKVPDSSHCGLDSVHRHSCSGTGGTSKSRLPQAVGMLRGGSAGAGLSASKGGISERAAADCGVSHTRGVFRGKASGDGAPA
jgi:hypothetical protein